MGGGQFLWVGENVWGRVEEYFGWGCMGMSGGGHSLEYNTI